METNVAPTLNSDNVLSWNELNQVNSVLINALIHTGNESKYALGAVLAGLVTLRASQINDCGFCIELHTSQLWDAGEKGNRIDSLSNWQGSDLYSETERSALRFAEAATRLTDKQELQRAYHELFEHFDKEETVHLLALLVTINSWNRIAKLDLTP